MIQTLTHFVALDETAGAELGKLLMRLQATVPGEAGNLAYQVFAAANDRTAFFCLESWMSQANFDGHLGHNDETGVNAAAAELLAAPPKTIFITAIAIE